MSTSTKFLKAECGQQSAFGTVNASPNVKLPFTGEYEDLQEEHEAEWDQGTWTPLSIVEQVAGYAQITLSGVMFFEFLPIIHNMGWGNVNAVDETTHYQYDGSVSPSAVGSPIPYTFLLGGNEAIGGTGPAIRIQDAYVESYTLAGNMNSKEVALSATLFGLQVDDNADAGYAFIGAALPSNLGMMKTLKTGVNYQDATATGGDFATMTALACAMLDWSLTFNTGLVAKWASDQNQLTYCGVRHVEPSVEFTPTIRTDATTYAAIKAKADARTFQEIQINLTGDAQRALAYNLTGRWLPNFIAHSRSDDEVVMQPTFRVSTPHTQTTTPHFLSWTLDTEWEHS